MKAKRKSIPTLKKELLDLQAKYVKLFYANGSKRVACFTCDNMIPINTYFCQCGHCFSKSGYPALQLNLDNQRVQCDVCNITLNGNEKVFKERLKADLGEERFAWLEQHKNDTVKLNRTDLEGKIMYFKYLVNEMQNI